MCHGNIKASWKNSYWDCLKIGLLDENQRLHNQKEELDCLKYIMFDISYYTMRNIVQCSYMYFTDML